MRLRSLHVREGTHLTTESLFETKLRERDLARRLVELERRQRAVADPVRFDADAGGFELGELAPVDGAVLPPVQCEALLVRQRLLVVEVADGTKMTAG